MRKDSNGKIKLPENFDDRIKKTINDTCKKTLISKRRKKNGLIAASLGFVVSGGFLVANPQYVEAAINSIKEVFAKRNYSIVLDNGDLSEKGVYEVTYLGIKFKYEIDTSVSGIIRIEETVDRSSAKAEDWKIKEENYNIDTIGTGGSELFTREEERGIIEKIYSGKDVSKDLEAMQKRIDEEAKKNEQLGEEFFMEGLKEVKECYDWGMSDEDFPYDEGVGYYSDITINGEQTYGNSDHSQEGKVITEVIIPENLIGKKNLNLEIKLKDIILVENLAVSIKEEIPVNIKLKATTKESAIKYIPVDYTYKIDGMRETTVQEVIIYPDGKRVEVLYLHGDMEDNIYNIRSFDVVNEGGTEIKETGENGHDAVEGVDSEKIDWSKLPWRKKYEGKVTGDTIKLIPRVMYKDNNGEPEDLDEVIEKAQPITLKVK